MLIRILIAFLAFLPSLAQAQDRQVPTSQQQVQFSYAPVVKQVAPAVVNIITKRQVTVRYSPFMNDPFFSRFFSDNLFGGSLRQRMQNTLGSGVIATKDGMVITNSHVIKDSDEITVILSDGREFDAKLLLQDDASDLALLQIDAEGEELPFVTLKPSESLEVGDIVLAIGNPFGVGQTVTSGIVSAQGRSSLDINDFNFFIQTDAAINPGNSGGALVALDGGVVGINTAIFSRDGGSMGIGFAVPSEMVSSVLAAAQSGQTGTRGIARPWLGVTAEAVTADIAESLGLRTPHGVLIAQLHSASPLKKAGIRVGDVVTGMNNRPLRDSAEMKFRMATVPLGDTAQIEVLRDNKTLVFNVKATVPPDEPSRQETSLDGQNPLNGATIANINPAVAVELDLKEEQGVVVSNIMARSPATRVVAIGDILLQINGQDIKNVKDAVKALKKPSNQGWAMTVKSKGGTRQIVMR